MKPDLYSEAKVLELLPITDFATDIEGTVVDVSEYNGRGLAILRILEDASQAATEKLDVTLHQVDSDSDALDSSNQIAAFAQVVGGNNGGATMVEKLVAVPFNAMTKQNIQAKLTETNTYEGFVEIILIAGGAYQEPVNA